MPEHPLYKLYQYSRYYIHQYVEAVDLLCFAPSPILLAARRLISVVLQREEIKVKNQDKPWIILKFRQLSQIENE